MMPWSGNYDYPALPSADGGRPWPRLVRGLLWAIVATFVISVLSFWLGRLLAEDWLQHLIFLAK